jgi:hypothetical protein
MNLLATSANVTAMGLLGNSTTVTNMGLLGTSAVVTDLGILATADVVADMNVLATADVVADMNTLATSDIVADLNTLATSDIVTDMNLLATSANVTAMGLLGTSAVVTDMGLLGTSAVVTDLDLLATSANVTAMGLLGNSATVTDLGILGTSAIVSDLSDVADNIAGVNSFADRYRVASSAPGSSLDEGDLYFDTTANTLNHYNGSAWVVIQSYSVGDGGLSQINFTSADNTKLDAIEASADVTDTTNVTAAGALMDSELAGIAAVKATTGTFLSADESKLDGIEASADVTDSTNVVAALTAGTGITISGGGTIAAGPIALTTVQTAGNQSAHLALTTEEGDVVVRSDEGKTYMHNGGTASAMADFTLLATPTDAVTSVAGNTGVVTNAHIATAVEAASDSNTFTDADHSKLDAIAASANNYTHPTSAGNVHIPSGGASGQVLKYASAGTAAWGSDDAVAMAIALG